MTRYTPNWLQQGSYLAAQDRRLLAAIWPNAFVTGCTVSAASGMTVNVAAGTVVVPTQNSTGSTLCVSDAVEQVTLTAAPGSGSNRYDLITCQPRGNDLDGGANNDFVFTYVTGTPAASPVAPAVPAGQVGLAQIYVPGGSASVTAGNITDTRPIVAPGAGQGCLAAVTYCPATQQAIQIGGSWAAWNSNFAISFVVPPSGVIIVEAELEIAHTAAGTTQMGWQGSGIITGTGVGQCPPNIVAAGSPLQLRVRTSNRIYGLNPGARMTLTLYEYTTATAFMYCGGPATGGNVTNNAGPFEARVWAAV